MTRALVVGDAHLDVTVVPALPLRSGADVPGGVNVGPGGQGANLAVRLARLGVDVALVCALADDAAGTIVRDALDADGVEVRALPTEATGAVAVLLDERGERTMVSRRAALSPHLQSVAVGDPDWVVVSGYVLLEADAMDAVAGLATGSARRALVGCAVPPQAVGAWRAAAAGLSPHLVVLNRDEAGLADSVPADAVHVVTRPDGADATLGAVHVDVATEADDEVVDTTGAGDALAAALVARLDAWPPDAARLRDALVAGVALASAVARVPGAQARVASETPPVVSR